jgi:hypothetical protein
MPMLQSKLPDDPGAALRDRLVALRDDTLRQLAAADHLDAGLVALLGNVGSALAVLDRPASPAPPAAAVVPTRPGMAAVGAAIGGTTTELRLWCGITIPHMRARDKLALPRRTARRHSCGGLCRASSGRRRAAILQRYVD